MAAAVWKGSISFGLLSIPIRLFPAARSERINLHQIHKECHTRLRQPLYCPKHRRIVDRSEVIKGYEYEKGHYIFIEAQELKKIAPPSSKNMEIQAFVKSSQIDPIFFESSYLALAEKGQSEAVRPSGEGAGRFRSRGNRQVDHASTRVHRVHTPEKPRTDHSHDVFRE